VKVAIDIRRINDFGVGTYIRNIVRSLAELGSTDQFYLIGSPARVADFIDLPDNLVQVPLTRTEETPRDWVEFRNVVKRLECDVVHVPHLFWRPVMLPCPYVVTVHDLLTYFYPTTNGSRWRRFIHNYMTRRSLTGAARILAVSKFTRNDIVRLFNIAPKKISVVYNAIDQRFTQGHATDADREMIAERYQVNYPFILYAGNITEHKNVGRIIEAFSALKVDLAKENRFPDLKLIIIGDELSKHPDLRRTVIKSAVQNEVRFLGFVPIDVLRIFYDAAKVFVFPSLYEGFGFPPLEAMAHGTPVVTSNVSSLPEVVGNAAVLVNPENVFEITRAVHRVLVDPSLRERMKERGYEQVKKFSWTESARCTLEVYRQVAGPA
jgi:glycosyltransferase involved in cell wall biosynthesis